MKYPQIVKAVAETPWAIVPERMAAIVEFVALRASGQRFTDEEIAERIGAGTARRQPRNMGSVAILPLYGVLAPRADLFTQASGGTSLASFQRAFGEALDDPQVDSILLDVDSPGGSTDLVPETAQMVRAARGRKPVWAIANTDANSAAYWIGSQAEQFFASPSAHVGSIGVFAAHDDVSAAQERMGVKTTLISAGKHKVEGNPFEPLSDEAREAIQARVDEFYGMFVHAVAKGRGVPVDAVRGGFGEGRVVTANQALSEGMVDGVATFDEVVKRLFRAAAPSSRSVAVTLTGDADAFARAIDATTFTDDARALRDRATALVERLDSLAEVRDDGRLTKAKREALAACPASLREAADRIDAVLAATDPDKQTAELALIRARANAALV